MNKKELMKEYQEIVLKTNGGNDDYVVALCQISNAISQLDDITELQDKVKELESQLENAIVPKFKIGQEVWYLYIDDNYSLEYGKIMAKQYFDYDGEHFEYAMSEDGTRDTLWSGYINEKYIFATKEEAEAKLKELKKW